MKYPNHILLDVSKPSVSYSSEYWIFRYFSNLKKNINFLNSLTTHRRFLLNKDTLFQNKLMSNQKKFTVKYNLTNPAKFLTESEKSFFLKVYEPRLKVKNRVLDSNAYGKVIYDFLKNPELMFDEKSIRRLYRNFNYKTSTPIFKSTYLWNLFDINFLRKEKIYTKLKYSRVPQYDIVSGGAAALLAGFLGFLICEKFGFELVDSGDFYFLFMYIVFLLFFCRLYLKIMDGNKASWNIVSFKWLIFFYKTILIMFISFCKNFFK